MPAGIVIVGTRLDVIDARARRSSLRVRSPLRLRGRHPAGDRVGGRDRDDPRRHAGGHDAEDDRSGGRGALRATSDLEQAAAILRSSPAAELAAVGSADVVDVLGDLLGALDESDR